MKKLLLPLLSLLILVSNAEGFEKRIWINKEGKSFEGEFVESDDKNVTIRRTRDRIKFTLPISDLSQADQDYLTKLAEEKKIEEEKERKSSDDYIPATKEELLEWIVDTEWTLTEEDNKISAMRFYPDGVVKLQTRNKKWERNDIPTEVTKYKMQSAKTIKFGGNLSKTGIFNEDFSGFRYVNSHGKKGEAKFIRKIKLDE